jgi:O-antigen/teichoic acid export membrane protein
MLTRLGRPGPRGALRRATAEAGRTPAHPTALGESGEAATGGVIADRLDSVRGMATRFGLAVCDQALFAGTSFAFTLLLGRWATQEDFGAFSVAFSVFVLLQNVFEGLVFEPFGVYGSGRLSQHLDAYIGRLLIGHFFIAGALAGAALLIALVLGAEQQTTLANAFLGMGLATPFLLGRILTRQALYITARVHWSAVVGVVYLVCSVTVLSLLRSLGLVTPFSAFLALGSGSLVASLIVVLVFLAPVWRSTHPELSPRRLMTDHFTYGGWAIGERLLLWFQTNVFFLELPLVAGLHASAAFRAVSTLAMPAYMTISAVAAVLLPALVRAQASQAQPQWAKWLIPGAMAGAFIYCVLLISFGQQAAHIAFAGQYDADLNLPLLAAAGVGPVLFAAAIVVELRLRAGLMIRQVLVARATTTGLLLLAGVALVAWYHVLGAALALALTWLTTVCVHIFLNWRRRNRVTAACPIVPEPGG